MRIKQIWSILLIACISIISCKQEDKDPAPIAFEDMKNILIDMHVAEYKAQGVGDKAGTFLKHEDSLAYYYASIIHKHNLDTTVFRKAIDWYMMHPQIFDSMYQQIVVKLEQEQETFLKNEAITTPESEKRVEQMINNLKSTNEPPPFKEDNNENEQ